MKLFIVVEEDLVGARAVFASADKVKCTAMIKRDYARELRCLTDDLFRCGSSVISIQEVEVE
jgi:hypothetical protein